MITKENIKYFIENYPKIGKKAIMEKLNLTDSSVRYLADKYHLKSEFKFNLVSNFNRGCGFRGKKRPDHSRWLKKNHPLLGKHHTNETKEKISSKIKNAVLEGRVKTDNFKGHKHSEISKSKISKASIATWLRPDFKLNSKEYRQKLSDRMSISAHIRNKITQYSRAKKGWLEIGGKKIFCRSSWEKVYAKYIQHLKENGSIKDWQFEPDVFWFYKIKRGVRSYKPDFKVFYNDNSIVYHEVKGWLDNKSKTKLKRMKKYYPEVKLLLIDATVIKPILKWDKENNI